MVRFSIFGIPVLIQPFFWITLVIIGGYGAHTKVDILRVGLFVIAGFISVLVHELGHALTARKFGAYSEIVLQAFGGYAAYSGVRLTRPQSFAVTAAGPAIQILLGVAIYLLLPHLPSTLSPDATYFIDTLMVISIFWALLNLLPVLPLDGGRMLDAILGPKRIKITLWLTIIVAISLALAAFKFTGSILLPIFLGMFAWQAFQALKENRLP